MSECIHDITDHPQNYFIKLANWLNKTLDSHRIFRFIEIKEYGDILIPLLTNFQLLSIQIHSISFKNTYNLEYIFLKNETNITK